MRSDGGLLCAHVGALPAPGCKPHPLAAIVDAMPLAAGLVDEHGDLVAANRAWAEAKAPLASILPHPGAGYLEALREHGLPVARELAERIAGALKQRRRTTQEYAVGALPAGPAQPELETSGTNSRARWVTRVASAGKGLALVTHEDASDRIRTRADLQRSRTRLRTILTGAPLALFAVDLDGRFTLVEGMAVSGSGLITPDVVGRGLTDTHGHLPDFLRVVETALEGSTGVTTIEIGAKAFEVRCSPDITGGGRLCGAVGVATDVTERVRAQRMKDDFVSVVNHELRTPLTSIHGSLSLLENNVAGELPSEAIELTKIARTSVDRLIRLIGDLLDLDRLDAGRLELRRARVDVASVVTEAARELSTFARDAGVRVDLSGCVSAFVHIDVDRVHQVASNLLSNAIKFSPAGSSVDVRVERRTGSVRVSVRDRGPGISAADRPKLFRKFSQLASSGEAAGRGSGLGLVISRAIVEAHGGRLALTSEVGKGSTFFFELAESRRTEPTLDRPLPAALGEHVAPRSSPAPRPVPSGLDVLTHLFPSPGADTDAMGLEDAHAHVQLLLADLAERRAPQAVLDHVTSLRKLIEREMNRIARGGAPDMALLFTVAEATHRAAAQALQEGP